MLIKSWIRSIAILVPLEYRRDWIEEWEAELASASHKKLRHAVGALPDAWYLCREGWTMEGLIRDARMALKGLVRRPVFTAIAGLTLAIGIGANTAIFSVVDGVLLNPLPYPESEELVSANHVAPALNLFLVPHSEGTYLHYSEHFRSLESLAIFGEETINLITDGDPQRLRAARVSQPIFEVLGVPPMLGRGFAEGEDELGAEPVAVLSYGLWRQTFGGDASILGRLVEMSGVQRRVIGVMPEGFEIPDEVSVWIPLEIDRADPEMGSLGLIGLGRLAPDATIAMAQAEMRDLMFQLSDENPDDFGRALIEQAGLAPDVKPLKELYVEEVKQTLWILLGTVGFVLLIACANVANLFLVRAEGRQREQALKTALGANRADIMRQYLSESVLLAAASGALGLFLAYLGVKGLLAAAPVTVPRSEEIGIDGTVLLFTATISLASGLLFGIFPALASAGRDLSKTLKDGGKSSTSGRDRHRVRSVLVVAQVALALVLLVGSGLMARSFWALSNVEPGFDSSDRLTFRIALPEPEWPEAEGVLQFQRQFLERLGAIAGVQNAAFISAVPLVNFKTASPMESEENPVPEGGLGPLVDRRTVSPGAFAALGIDLVEGRDFTWGDSEEGIRNLIVSQTLARTFWPEAGSVVGRRIRQQGDTTAYWNVIGVAEDVHFERLTEENGPLAYFPAVNLGPSSPAVTRSVAVVLHTGADPLGFVGAAREALREVGPRLPMVEPRTLESIERDALSATSFTVVLLGIASAIALVLGMVGIYGVISFVVSRRSQEIGVRMALGAPAVTVLRSVVGQGMKMTGVGIVVGLLGAWGVSNVIVSLLYDVSGTDPLTYVTTALVLALVALIAAWIPARRASRIDPVEALRYE